MNILEKVNCMDKGRKQMISLSFDDFVIFSTKWKKIVILQGNCSCKHVNKISNVNGKTFSIIRNASRLQKIVRTFMKYCLKNWKIFLFVKWQIFIYGTKLTNIRVPKSRYFMRSHQWYVFQLLLTLMLRSNTFSIDCS